MRAGHRGWNIPAKPLADRFWLQTEHIVDRNSKWNFLVHDFLFIGAGTPHKCPYKDGILQ